MYKRVALNGLAVLGLLAGAAAHADVQPGFYVGAGVGQATLEVDGSGFDADDTSFKVFGGYAFNQNFAVELTYLNGGKPDETFRVGTVSVNVEGELTGFNASVIGRLPLNESFSLFAKAGYGTYDIEITGRSGNTRVSFDDDGSEFSYGAGAAFSFNESFELRAEYEALNIDDGDFNVISVGALFRF